MSRFTVLPAFLLLSVPLTSATAQAPAAAPITVTTTAVSRVTMYRIVPGQNGALNRDIVENLIPTWEEFKKAGIIVSYSFISNATASSPDDWNFGTILTYPNYAALDNLGTKTNPITLKQYGTAEKRTAAANARNTFRTLVSSSLITTTTYTR